MSNVQKFTDSQLLKAVEQSEGFPGYKPGMVIDVWARSDEDAYNKFDDKVYTFVVDENSKPHFAMVCTGTSNAGAEGLKRFDKYNREGCAILKSNVFVKDSHKPGLHKGKYPAYRQVRSFPYYRDGDKDNKAEEIGAIHNDIIGANCHKAGWFSTEIGGWSVACLVRNQMPQWNAWLKFMNKRPLSVVILTETQILNANKRTTAKKSQDSVAPQNVTASLSDDLSRVEQATEEFMSERIFIPAANVPIFDIAGAPLNEAAEGTTGKGEPPPPVEVKAATTTTEEKAVVGGFSVTAIYNMIQSALDGLTLERTLLIIACLVIAYLLWSRAQKDKQERTMRYVDNALNPNTPDLKVT